MRLSYIDSNIISDATIASYFIYNTFIVDREEVSIEDVMRRVRTKVTLRPLFGIVEADASILLRAFSVW